MINHNSQVLKTVNSADFSFNGINKTLCTIDPKNMAELLDHLDLTANPRSATKNQIVKSIGDSLKNSPEYMVFKTKGLLIACQNFEILQRGRYRLNFDENSVTDGLLDGGHNVLAIGIFILEEYFAQKDKPIPKDVRKIKRWVDFVEVWQKYKNDLTDFISTLEFQIPVEIIYPQHGSEDVFADKVFEISDARNNNNSLTDGTMADHRGYYDILKKFVDPVINDCIEWKDGEAGKYIKRDDIVALSLIPFIALQRAGKLDHINVGNINPISIYSSKGSCTATFSKLIEELKLNDDIVDDLELPPLIESAFSLMKDIPYLYDLIYSKFPNAYNDVSPGFGRISKVKETKEKKSKTKYYKSDSDYRYPDGFIVPIVVALHTLIGIDGDKVYWKVENIREFVEKNLKGNCEMLVSTIKDNSYDPQNVGKSAASYKGMEMQFNFAVMKSKY
ncbi:MULTISPECIES: hypothetical protein [unclassified Psychrobacter]|uniref:hypothetical protein n=1 Tax=unclassified Psychrobacter TaxID=196806 RepID=UPI003F4890CD